MSRFRTFACLSLLLALPVLWMLAAESTPVPSSGPNLRCVKNGKAWEASSSRNSCIYYGKGIPGLHGGQPFWFFNFTTDSRAELRFTCVGADAVTPRAGRLPDGAVECQFFTPNDGQPILARNRPRGMRDQPCTPFNFTILYWNVISKTEVKMSARFSGEIFPLGSKVPIVLEDGQIAPTRVSVTPSNY